MRINRWVDRKPTYLISGDLGQNNVQALFTAYPCIRFKRKKIWGNHPTPNAKIIKKGFCDECSSDTNRTGGRTYVWGPSPSANSGVRPPSLFLSVHPSLVHRNQCQALTTPETYTKAVSAHLTAAHAMVHEMVKEWSELRRWVSQAHM
jgi:hypothetical protein